MVRLLVDFNEVRNDRVGGLQQYVEGPRSLAPGDRVIVHDDGDEEAWAEVERVEDDRIYLVVDWSTFGPAGRFHGHHEPTGAWWLLVQGASTVMHDGQPKLWHVIGMSEDDLIRDEEEHSAASPEPA